MGEHILKREIDGEYYCELCKWSWVHKPTQMFCPGVPRYEYGAWPDWLRTKTQLKRLKMKPSNPAGCYFLNSETSKPIEQRYRYLYDMREAK